MLFFPFSFHAHVEPKRADNFFYFSGETWGVTTEPGKLNIPKDLLIGRGKKFKSWELFRQIYTKRELYPFEFKQKRRQGLREND